MEHTQTMHEIEAITNENKIKIFKRNKEDKKMFIDYLLCDEEVFVSVSNKPLTIIEDGTKIFKCVIEKKDIKYVCEITEKFYNWCVESEIIIKE